MNRSRHDFLAFVLQSSNRFILKYFFQFRFSLFPPACLGSCSVFAFRVLWFFCFVLHKMIGFFGFFGLKFSNCSPLKLIFSEGPYFLYVLFVIMGLWNWPARGSPVIVIGHVMTRRVYKKMNRSRHDFLAFVLQSSNRFILKYFFQFRFSLFPPACLGSCSVFALGVLWFFCFVLRKMIGFFFLVWNFQTIPR